MQVLLRSRLTCLLMIFCSISRAVVESVHKLDVIIGSKASYREVFKPENISLRNKYVQLSQQCVREVAGVLQSIIYALCCVQCIGSLIPC